MRIRVVLVVSAAFLTAMLALAQTPAASPAPSAAPQAAAPQAAAPREYKNLQVLKDMSHDDIQATMNFFRSALGVECEFCHVRVNGRLQPDLDDKKEKKTAREMLAMTKALNDQYFEGHQRVTCASCHNGHEEPRAFPPLADLETAKARLEAQQQRQQLARAQPPGQPAAPAQPQAPAQAPARPALPQAAELFAKYEQAIGGAAALDKLTSRVDRYTTTNARGDSTPGETYRKAPDKVLSVVSFGPDRVQSLACDGTTAWRKNPRGTETLAGAELAQMKFVANFWRDLRPSARYAQARTTGRQKINGHDAYVVRGVVRETRVQEQLFFDAESGLLLRRVTYQPTPMGPLADQIDFEDYREAGGVKVAFVLKTATPETVSTRTYTDVKFNVPVDDSKFAAPPADAKPAGE